MIVDQLSKGRVKVRFGDMVEHISRRVEPSETNIEIYVGLEHLEPETLRINSHGVPGDVTGQKLFVKKGQIIFGKRRAYQRKVAVADWDCICSAHAMVLEAKSDSIMPAFLPFFIQSDTFMSRAVSISEGSLSPTIKWKALAQQLFLIPNRKSQARLVEMFSLIDNNLAFVEAAIESADMLHNKLVFELANNPGFESEERELDDLCELVNGNGFSSDSWADKGLPIIRIQNLNGGEDFNFYNGKILKKWFVQNGDLLFAWSGVKGSSFGPYLWGGGDAVLNQHIFKVNVRPGVDKDWLYFALKKLTREIESVAHGFKSTLLHVKKSEILKKRIKVPGELGQIEVASVLKNSQDVSKYLKREKLALLNKKRSIMTALLD